MKHARAVTVVGVVLLSVLLASAGPAFAQADTALARQVHADVGRQLASFDKVSFEATRPDVEYRSEVKAWADASGVRKLEVTDRDDSGDVVTEYYYAGGALVFVYQAIKGFDDAGKQVTRGEERQYFRDDKMFKWLSGKEAAANAPADPAFAEEGSTRLAASAFYVKAAREAYARKAPAATAKPAPGAPPTGRFERQRKEDGIVAHF
ncbi:MAG: hypothetical protein NDJ94_23890, partial [Vicinamibacteria bacterium]|nr:hypothetical protein [Vicinamibacteria bacterium]